MPPLQRGINARRLSSARRKNAAQSKKGVLDRRRDRRGRNRACDPFIQIKRLVIVREIFAGNIAAAVINQRSIFLHVPAVAFKYAFTEGKKRRKRCLPAAEWVPYNGKNAVTKIFIKVNF